jgi:uncharacterized membrane protein YphA (DoxX/SURF4 family)
MRFFLYFCRMSKLKTIAPIALKMLLGLMFIVSAILKVFDMDKFEIYIYSYHFFSLNFSFLVARAAIIAELVLGIGLVSNCLHKPMWWGSMAMLMGYTLLLIYAQIIGRTDSCHCFGDVLPFNPWQSILKNSLLMGLFALVYRVKEWRFKGQWLALVGVAIAASVVIFCVSPPDNFTPNYQLGKNLQTEYFETALAEPPLDNLHLDEGKQIVCLFTTGCRFCQMSARKLSLMQQFYGFPADRITYVFMGSEEGIEKFYELSESARYRNVLFQDVRTLLKITDGNFPVLVFMDNGTVIHEYGFRNMKEGEIKAFME